MRDQPLQADGKPAIPDEKSYNQPATHALEADL